MYLLSAYAPFQFLSCLHEVSRPISDKVIFVDFGCGPLTSGIGFWTFARQSEIIYLGIDSSHAMCHKTVEINQYGPYRGVPFFRKDGCIFDYNRLHQYLDTYITRGDQTQIIFNFCYFLASKTLNIVDLSDCLTRIVAKYSQHKMYMVYQNPIKSPDSHRNWLTVKGKLSTFRGQITQSNIEKFSCDWFRLQNGRLIWRKSFPIDVYFDILSNESSALFNDPFE